MARFERIFLVCLLAGGCRLGLENSTVGDGGFVVPPGCGDGVIGAGEECDDGNFVNTDSCLENCQLASCGDGVVREYIETCDDGNSDEDDGCSSFCGSCPEEADARYVSSTTEHCYTLTNLQQRHGQAREQCRALGGELVGLSSAEELAEVSAGLVLGEATWIGLVNGNTGWYWANGELPQFTNWDEGFPDAEVRTVQLPSGLWQTAAEAERPYICEIAPTSQGWKVRDVDGHAYKRFASQSTWELAQLECEALGAHLATIGSAEEFLFVSGVNGTNPAWIGLSGPQDTFEWVTGELFDIETSFTDWALEQPNTGSARNCVHMGDHWNDIPCDTFDDYICELD